MQKYISALNFIMNRGFDKSDRTGTGTRSVFGYQMQFDLQQGFPLLTTKKLHWKSIVHELLWMLSGSTDVKDLQRHGVTIWDEWADKDGSLGPVYGWQWRHWGWDIAGPGIDQIAKAVELLKNNPDSRRNVVSAWNVSDLGRMALEPCHMMFQLWTRPLRLEERVKWCYDTKGRRLFVEDLSATQLDEAGVPRLALSLHMYQRSADAFLGVPFNIASYALLTHMFAHVTNMVPSILTISYGDLHIYHNHFDQVIQQRARRPQAPPWVTLNKDVKNISSFQFSDISLHNYNPLPAIAAPVAV